MIFKPGHQINKPAPLFVKIDVARIEELKQKYGGVQQTETKAEAPKVDTAHLESEIAKQAEKVRTLKTSADKSVWQPEVSILLELKNKLAGLLGTAPDADKKSKKKGKK
jgi:methionyl-tRNA synthetase